MFQQLSVVYRESPNVLKWGTWHFTPQFRLELNCPLVLCVTESAASEHSPHVRCCSKLPCLCTGWEWPSRTLSFTWTTPVLLQDAAQMSPPLWNIHKGLQAFGCCICRMFALSTQAKSHSVSHLYVLSPIRLWASYVPHLILLYSCVQ